MSVLRWLAVGAVVCLAGSGARAADNAKLIVGQWEITKPAEGGGGLTKGSVVEFFKDGKIKVTRKGDTDMVMEGTYKLDGDMFTATTKVGEEERVQTITIVKLTDTELHVKNKDGKQSELTRKK
jgi:uncharacterized protein (TIGR03066 family)